MPNIDTTTLPNVQVNGSYSQTVSASKVVGMAVSRSGAVSYGGADPLGDVTTGIANEFTYTISSDSEDDLVVGAVTISNESNCSVNITTDPESAVVEPSSSTNLVIDWWANGTKQTQIGSVGNLNQTNGNNWGISGTALDFQLLRLGFASSHDTESDVADWASHFEDLLGRS